MHKEQTVKQHAEALRLHTWYPVTVNGVRINTISDQQLANIQLTPNSEGKCELGPDRRAAEMVIQFAYHPPTFLAQLDREPERLSALQQLAMKYQSRQRMRWSLTAGHQRDCGKGTPRAAVNLRSWITARAASSI
ncbi:hypothetical protein WJX72_009230 [[Myrmecia] bisecta]|uniref:Uncharacterized protein n=1 Tax=[Myrmecia] bisecta TaxID=41462 RepID=A0AAW1R916_9CHLO